MKRMRVAVFGFFLSAAVAHADPFPEADAVFGEPDMDLIRLGQLLFYDPVLSGNRTVACATCHHPKFATTDGVSLGLGDGGVGVGPARRLDGENLPEQRIGRNAPALFNLGAAEFTTLFHDGRLEADAQDPSGFRTPLGADMETGFSGVLSAQTMFPVLSPDEMAGHYSENDVAQAVRKGVFTGPEGAWAILTARVGGIAAYREGFARVLPVGGTLHFSDISNAIAAFMAFEWRADDSPFDRHLRGEMALSGAAARGMDLFYGDAGCSVCHAGQFQTDHRFHAIGMPQIGPGKAARFERHSQDMGRLRVTGAESDAYAFRTPSLRNVVFTGPYGHAGSYRDLKDVVRHHLDPLAALNAYDTRQAVLPEFAGVEDFSVVQDAGEVARIGTANTLIPVRMNDEQVADILAFLAALTDETSLTGRLGVPDRVPSGLPVDQ